MQPIEGDAILHGKEESLNFYTDAVYLDQMRGGANCGGRIVSCPLTMRVVLN